MINENIVFVFDWRCEQSILNALHEVKGVKLIQVVFIDVS